MRIICPSTIANVSRSTVERHIATGSVAKSSLRVKNAWPDPCARKPTTSPSTHRLGKRVCSTWLAPRTSWLTVMTGGPPRESSRSGGARLLRKESSVCDMALGGAAPRRTWRRPSGLELGPQLLELAFQSIDARRELTDHRIE